MDEEKKNIIQLMLGFVRRANGDHVSAYAAQAAYFLIMSFIPFILFLTTLIRYTPLSYNVVRDAIIGFVPGNLQTFVLSIVVEVYKRSTAIVPLSALMALWASGKGMQAITNGLNTIYHVKETRNWLMTRIYSVFYMLLFVLAIIVTLLVLVLGNRIQVAAQRTIPILGRLLAKVIGARTLLVFAVLFAVFLVLYKVLPNRKATFKSQLPGAFMIAVAWMIFSYGFSVVGMLSVAIGAVANLILDPLFIFVLGFGVRGAAIATILSQTLSAAFVLFFLTGKAELKVRFLRKNEISECTGYAKNIVSLGMAGFIMQLTNSLVTICCNNVLSVTGGDIYISVMTIISSVRQLVETPIHAINEGTSPILSYNYGARRPTRVRKSIAVLAVMILIYTGVMWGSIIMIPEVLIRIFSSDKTLMKDAVPALKQYFAAFIFMDLQYMGQTVFKSLNKKKQAIFFSLLRKVFIVVPLTYLMPYVLHMGTDGVFLAEPVSNVIGGSICFITMLCTVLPELKRMEARK